MVNQREHHLRPLRINRTGNPSPNDRSMPDVPQRAPARVVAPDWQSPTEGNGLAQPRATLHVALLAPDPTTATLWQRQARIITPPLWKGGKVELHIVVVNEETQRADPKLLQTLTDLGLIDATDAGFVGYPSGDPS
jgi:hypothetical protein